jgi:hypothetical protein
MGGRVTSRAETASGKGADRDKGFREVWIVLSRAQALAASL